MNKENENDISEIRKELSELNRKMGIIIELLSGVQYDTYAMGKKNDILIPQSTYTVGRDLTIRCWKKEANKHDRNGQD